jgi:hypothetical protein
METSRVTLAFAGSSTTAGGSSFCRFCIFSISDRFSASNRFRKMEEYVLNFIH